MTVLSRLEAKHQERLAWFAERVGQKTYYPQPLPDGLLLASRPKGIYKPADLDYALSVRIHLDSPYRDGEVRHRPDGSWYFDYHQENRDPTKRDREYTNAGLMACMQDGVPVGVLKELEVPPGARTEYAVLGLAVPVGWRDGYFFFESTVGPTGPRGDTAQQVLMHTAEDDLANAQGELPADGYDARRRVYRQIVARRGQRGFRKRLLTAYESSCAITGTATEPVLDAAHLRPYMGPDSNVCSNGLLLRTGVHALLDLQLLAIDPLERHVIPSKLLVDSPYSDLEGKRLREPLRSTDRPESEVLAEIFDAFTAAELLR